jgi:DNA topoisomerase VI subunit A
MKDVATRYLLNLISSSNVQYGNNQRDFHRTKIWNLVDGDPHGIDIHLIYKYGGKVMSL